MLVDEGKVDVFITYCTNAAEAKLQSTSLQVVAIPDAINVSAVYGIATVRPAGPAAKAFVNFVTSSSGQKVLAAYGFSAP
jgi:ABC-type molybdate transport system substrate-binding protein